jgi:hypothetical protein
VLYVSRTGDLAQQLDSDTLADHINNYMHPQALIVDASGPEDDYFLSGIRKQAPASGIPLIVLPENAHSRLAWITKLDSSSLAGTNTYKPSYQVMADIESSLGQDQHRHPNPRDSRRLWKPHPSPQVTVSRRFLGWPNSPVDYRSAV